MSEMTQFVCANCHCPVPKIHWRISYSTSIVDPRSRRTFPPTVRDIPSLGRICSEFCLEEFKTKHPEMRIEPTSVGEPTGVDE